SDGVITGDLILDRYTTNPLGHLLAAEYGFNTALPRRFLHTPDFMGRPVKTMDADGAVTERCYDERGLLLRETRAAGSGVAMETRFVYDEVGRTTAVHAPGGRVTRYDYDAFGRVDHVTLPNGSVVRSTWQELDLLSSQEVIGDPGDGSAIRVL